MSFAAPANIILRQSVVGSEGLWTKMYDPPTDSPPTPENLDPTIIGLDGHPLLGLPTGLRANPVPSVMEEALYLAPNLAVYGHPVLDARHEHSHLGWWGTGREPAIFFCSRMMICGQLTRYGRKFRRCPIPGAHRPGAPGGDLPRDTAARGRRPTPSTGTASSPPP